MKTKAIASDSLFEMTQNRAKRRQVNGHLFLSHPEITSRDRKLSEHSFFICRTCLLLVVLLLGLPVLVGAHTRKYSWLDLKDLKAGQGIVVIESSMKHHTGRFVIVTDESLTLNENGFNVSVKRENTVRVSTSSGVNRGKHVLIGFVAGGLIGAGIGAASGSNSGLLDGTARGIGALVGLPTVPSIASLLLRLNPQTELETSYRRISDITQFSRNDRKRRISMFVFPWNAGRSSR